MLESLKKRLIRRAYQIDDLLLVDPLVPDDLDDFERTPLLLRWIYLIEAIVRKRGPNELVKIDPLDNPNAYCRACHRWYLYSNLLIGMRNFICFLEECITWPRKTVFRLKSRFPQKREPADPIENG